MRTNHGKARVGQAVDGVATTVHRSALNIDFFLTIITFEFLNEASQQLFPKWSKCNEM